MEIALIVFIVLVGTRGGRRRPRLPDRRERPPAAVPRVTDHLPAALARQVGERGEIAIRPARPADVDAIRRLAQLVDRAVPAEPVLLAESDGAVVVALSTATGRGRQRSIPGDGGPRRSCSGCARRSCTTSRPEAGFSGRADG